MHTIDVLQTTTYNSVQGLYPGPAPSDLPREASAILARAMLEGIVVRQVHPPEYTIPERFSFHPGPDYEAGRDVLLLVCALVGIPVEVIDPAAELAHYQEEYTDYCKRHGLPRDRQHLNEIIERKYGVLHAAPTAIQTRISREILLIVMPNEDYDPTLGHKMVQDAHLKRFKDLHGTDPETLFTSL